MAAANKLFSPTENFCDTCPSPTTTTRLMCYDQVGNLIRDKHVTNAGWMVYDSDNKLYQHNVHDVQDDSIVYLYDADGKRKQSYSVATGTLKYIHGLGGELVYEAGSAQNTKKEYAYRNGQLLVTATVAKINQSDVRWLVTDHLGTPRIIADRTGSLSAVKRHDYLPFGEEIGPGVGGRTTGQGYGTPQSDGVRQQFTGYERDLETGLDFAQARYMGSSLGRFTSPDPLSASASPGDPQSWNRYAFVLGNPINLTDSTGMSVDDDCPGSPGGRCPSFPIAINGPATGSIAIVDVVSDGIADVVNLAGRYVQSASDMFSYGFGRAQTEYQTGQPQEGPRIFGNQGPTSSEVLDQTMQSYQGAAQIAEVGFFQVQMIPFAAAAAAGGSSAVSTYRGSASSGSAVADDLFAPVDLPSQNHHFATIRNQRFTPEMAEIANDFGLSLKGSWNTQTLPHLGRHPNAYHEFVLTGMQNARNGANGSQAEFIRLFDLYVRQPVIQNPQLLRRAGW
ncbi:MAG: RHS repeat-associated core domain-containing protein [Pyrinomonadaceae bacterium]